LENFIKIIRANFVVGMQEALDVVKKLKLSLEKETEKAAEVVTDLRARAVSMSDQTREHLIAVYNDPAVQKVILEHPELMSINNLSYFFDHLDRIGQDDYMPNNEDILRCRQRTAGANYSTLYLSKKYFEFHDVGGQRPERAKWESVMEEHSFLSILFFVSVDEFDTLAAEEKDDERTKLELAKKTFVDFVKSKSLEKHCPIILFLNRKDMLETRIGSKKGFKAFQKTFEDYKGESDLQSCLDFLEKEITEDLDKDERNMLTIHHTCALDGEAMQVVWNSVREGILRATFAKTGVGS